MCQEWCHTNTQAVYRLWKIESLGIFPEYQRAPVNDCILLHLPEIDTSLRVKILPRNYKDFSGGKNEFEFWLCFKGKETY